MIGITMGDASGIGPELILKACRGGELEQDYLVIGDLSILDYANRLLGYHVPINPIDGPREWQPGSLNVLDLRLLQTEQLRIGQVSRDSGAAARQYVVHAVRLALAGDIGALVTLPMNKEATRLSDPGFTGHTELIAGLCGQEDYAMMLACGKLAVSHVSTHVSLADAIGQVRAARILQVIRLTSRALQNHLGSPRIAIAGLNPHAGENGAFGQEDLLEIKPAVTAARNEGIDAEGPIAPDTVFVRAAKGQFDAVVCMYHDQGHIPMKLLDFEGGVNVTLGLKIIRTSVDHGTAFDLAYQGKASTRSLVEAFKYAGRLMRR
jgi:4-phospho-D-threonate 3-dehydrogenase / 4-phospho-D-erythronate 3-dehydrogenase